MAGLIVLLCFGTVSVVAWRAETGSEFHAADFAALVFTVKQALLSAFFSVVFAVPVARALARRQFIGRKFLITLLGAPFVLPVIVAVLGLLAVFGRSGLVSWVIGVFGFEPVHIYGLHGVVIAHVFFNLPLAVRLILQGWLAIPAEHFRLAASLGCGPRDARKLLEYPMLREILPGIFAIIFLICTTSFAVALAIGGGPKSTTLELAIYQAFRFDFDLSKAALLAVVQVVLSGSAALMAWRLSRTPVASEGMDLSRNRFEAGRGAKVLDYLWIILATLFLGLPLAMVVIDGLPRVLSLPAGVWIAAGRSVFVALVSTAFTVAFGLALAFWIAGLGKATRGFGEAIGYLTVAVSPLVMGAGLFIVIFKFASPQDWALPITALVNSIVALPFAMRILIPAVDACETRFGRLARSLNLSGFARFRLLDFPRLKRPIGFVAGLAAALSMGDLGVIALFADPSRARYPLLFMTSWARTAWRMRRARLCYLCCCLWALFICLIEEGARMLHFENVILTQGTFTLRADFKIEQGAHVALLGPSGAGKSTLLSAVAGFLLPTDGKLLWDSQDLAPMGPGQRPMSILFQDNNLFPHLTVFQNVALGVRPDLKLTKVQKSQVFAALEQVGLVGKANAKPAEMSGGQRARVAIARLVLRARPIMLLDEPFSALGPALKKEMLGLVSSVARQTNATLLMITHEPEDARRIAEETVLVAGGRAFAPVPTGEALDNPPAELAAYLGV